MGWIEVREALSSDREMGPKEPTFRDALFTALLVVLGVFITILVIMGGTSFSRAEYGLGSLFLGLAAGLTFVFFRKRKTTVLIIGLIWVMVNAGVIGIVHPTVPGILVTVGSAAGLAILLRSIAQKRRTGQD